MQQGSSAEDWVYARLSGAGQNAHLFIAYITEILLFTRFLGVSEEPDQGVGLMPFSDTTFTLSYVSFT